MEIERVSLGLPDNFQNIQQNFHCDDPRHGYGCFHLDRPKSKNLKPAEQKEMERLQKFYSVETLEEAEDAFSEADRELDSAMDRVDELEGEVEELRELKRLMEKAEDGE